MSKPTPLTTPETIDIYNLITTKIDNDHLLSRNYNTTQNNTLVNFIEDNIVKIPKIKPMKANKSTMTDKQAFNTVISMITDISDIDKRKI